MKSRRGFLGVRFTKQSVLVGGGIPQSPPLHQSAKATGFSGVSDNVAALERVSCGEKILLAPPGGKIRGDKEVGFAALKEKDYHRAIESLQRDWNVAKDPETLIALNNAKLAVGSSQQIKTIAVVIPSRQTPIFVATHLLKGVAAAQDEWNQTNREWKLRVVIADDSNDPNEGKKIADEWLSPHNRVKCSDSYILPSSLLWTFT